MDYFKKHFFEKYEAIIHSEMKPIERSNTDGVIIPHKQQVSIIRYYEGIGTSKREMQLSKTFILDMAEEIKKLESVVEDLEQQENLPF